MNLNLVLRTAIQYKHWRLVLVLLQSNQIKKDAKTATNTVKAGIRYNLYGVIQCIIDDRQWYSYVAVPTLNNLFLWAIYHGQMACIRCLLADSRIDVQYQDNYAFAFAIRFGLQRIVTLLLQDGRTDPNIVFDVVLWNEHEVILNLFLQDKRLQQDTIDEGYTFAMKYKKYAMATLLLPFVSNL